MPNLPILSNPSLSTSTRKSRFVAAVLATALSGAAVVAMTTGAAASASGSTQPNPESAGANLATNVPVRIGDVWLNQSGSLSNTHITGSLYITGSHVSVTNVLVDGGIFINRTPGGGYMNPVPTNISLSQVTGHNISTLGFKGLTLDAVNLFNTKSGPSAQFTNYASNGVSYPAANLVVRNSWFHGVPSTSTGTVESVHMSGVHSAQLTNNEFSDVAPDSATQFRVDATVMLDSSSYGVYNSNVTLAGNSFYGGGYFQLYFAAIGTNSVTSNAFHSGGSLFTAVQYPPSAYGTASLPPGGYDYFTQSGNTLDGSAVSLPGGLGGQVTPTPTPTSSPTSSPTSAPTSSPVASPTPTSSPTTAPSSSPTSSPTPTASPTTASPMPTSTATPTPTPTQTSTAPTGTPDPMNAGVQPGSTLTPVSGDVLINSSNTTYSNASISGNLYITGSNVTVTNVQVAGDVWINKTPGGAYFNPVPSNVALHHVSATSVFTIGFNGLTLDAVNLSNPQNAPQAQIYCYLDSNSGIMYSASNLVVENSWFHGFQPSTSSAHLENLHMACVHGATITNNQFDLFSPDGSNTLNHFTANITLDAQQFGDWNQNVTISGNKLNGGSYYQLYFCSGGSNNSVTNNQFSSTNDPIFAGVQFPPSAYSSSSLPNGTYPKFSQGGNTLNGSAVSLPGGN